MSTTQVPLPVPPAPPAPRPVSWPSAGKPAPAPAPRRLRWTSILFAVLLLAAVGAGAYLVPRLLRPTSQKDLQLHTVSLRSFPVVLEEKGELEAAASIEIRSELEGKATIINLVDEGTSVKKGDLLVELASDVIDSNIRDQEIAEATASAAFEASKKELDILKDANASLIRKADLALKLAELAQEKYKEGESEQLKTEAKLAVEKAEEVLKRAKATYADSKDLFDQGFLTRIDLENDRFAEYAAGIELTKAQLAQKVLGTYTIPMALEEKHSAVTEAQKELERTRKSAAASEAKALADVEAKKAQLDVVREKLAKYRDQKAKSKIYAPADGLVVYARGDSWYRSENRIEKGTQVYERQSLIELPDTSSMKVVIRVHEAQIEYLKPGLPATVEIEGFTTRMFTGRVSKIGVLADSQNRWLNPDLKEYETQILLDGTFGKGLDLKPGTTARAKVELAQLNNVIGVPVQAVFAKNARHYVFLEDHGQVKVAPVQIGLASAEYVEIKSGLQAGQVIRLAVTDEMKLLLPEDQGSENDAGRHGGSRANPLPSAAPSGDGARSGASASPAGEGRSGGANRSGGGASTSQPSRSRRGNR